MWAVAPGRTLQDALTAEILQGHPGGYQLRNPPLYEWLLWGLQQVVGSGPFSYILLRYALIAAAGILFYFGLMRTVASTRVAAAFSLSLMLFFWFGWEAHHSVSHSLAIIVAMLALWLAALSYVDRPSLARAFGLGLIVGLGIMAKWSFLLVVISLGMALGLNRSTRRIFADQRSLMILAGALLPVLPFLLWLAALDPDVVTSRVAIVQPGSALEQTLEGAMDFISPLPLVFLPWILGGARACLSIKAPAGRGAGAGEGEPACARHRRHFRSRHGTYPYGSDAPRREPVRHHRVRRPLSLPAGSFRRARHRGAYCAARRARPVRRRARARLDCHRALGVRHQARKLLRASR